MNQSFTSEEYLLTKDINSEITEILFQKKTI
mgnify:CR=1 FL=1